MKPDLRQLEKLVRAALEEDAPWGDLSSQTFIPADARLTATLAAREDGVLCGEDLYTLAMSLTATPGAPIATTFHLHDGDHFTRNQTLATVEGPARAILQAERIALNFVQRLSAIATTTARYVAAAAGTQSRITDTRKTTPGLRLIERYAVRCGGGHNHRFSLSDAVMLKDNHLALLTGPAAQPATLADRLRTAAAHLPHTTHIEIEVDRLDQIEPILASGIVDTLLLDNFSLDDLRAAVALVARLAPGTLLEASGGVTLERIPAIASTGVDLISVGALTHSVRALDLGLDFSS